MFINPIISNIVQIVRRRKVSEIYYEQGWNAYIDGNRHQFSSRLYKQSNDGLKGEHIIEFKFEQ
jgi:hypothetical protein